MPTSLPLRRPVRSFTDDMSVVLMIITAMLLFVILVMLPLGPRAPLDPGGELTFPAMSAGGFLSPV